MKMNTDQRETKQKQTDQTETKIQRNNITSKGGIQLIQVIFDTVL